MWLVVTVALRLWAGVRHHTSSIPCQRQWPLRSLLWGFPGVTPSTCEAFQVWGLPGVRPSTCETFQMWGLPDVRPSRCAFDQNLHPVTPVSSFSEGEPRNDKISKLYKPRINFINPTTVVEVNPHLRSKVSQNSSLGYFYADSQKYLVHTLTFEKQT